jgi:hypothetical protein
MTPQCTCGAAWDPASFSYTLCVAPTRGKTGDRLTAVSTYRIDTRAVRVEACLGSGSPTVGEIFLRPGAASHFGAETVADRLADTSVFLPLRVEGEPRETLLLGKTQIRYLRAPAPADEDASLVERVGTSVDIEVTLDTGEKLSGNLFLELLPGQTRTLDFLNSSTAAFVCVVQGLNDCFVNRAHVRFFREVNLKEHRPLT